MRAGALGANATDLVASMLSIVVLVGVLLPGASPGFGAVAGSPSLVSAEMIAPDLLALTFDAPVAPTRDTWGQGFRVMNGGSQEPTRAWQLLGPARIALFLPGGIHEGDPVTVSLTDPSVIRGVDGSAVSPVDDYSVLGGEDRGRLPMYRGMTYAAWLDGAHYTFGGYVASSGPGSWVREAATDQIVRFDPATGESRILDARLPEPLRRIPVAVDPRSTPDCPVGCAYLFKGQTLLHPDAGGQPHGERDGPFLRFDPSSERIDVLPDPPANLPAIAHAVAWDGESSFYSFGGLFRPDSLKQGEFSERIWRFTPDTGAWEELATRLPYGVGFGSAVHDEMPRPGCPRGCIHIVGGWASHFFGTGAGPDAVADRTLEFDPVTGITRMHYFGDAPAITQPYSQSALLDGAIWWTDKRTAEGAEFMRFDVASGTRTLHAFPDAPSEFIGLVTDGSRLITTLDARYLVLDPDDVPPPSATGVASPGR